MTEQDDDFARMFEASQKAKRIEEGDTVQGTVVALWPDVAFLDVGGKGEATIAIEELKDEDGALEVEVGDRIEAVVVSTSGGLTLSRKLARGAAGQRQVQEAFRAGLPVEGKVERAVKGGFEVRIGGQRAFCPVSQIDLVRGSEPQTHEGRVYTFRILEFKEGGRDLVVSRRVLLEEEQRERAEEIRQGILPGAVLSGQVASVRDYGAFVDLGAGIQGLLHVSEMGWGRVADPAAVVKPGDAITVKVLRVEEKTGKISLGLKQLQADPWARVPGTYAAGQVHRGRVTRQADFGAFVELEPGIEALAHASTFPPTGKAGAWKEAVPPGTEAAFEILTVDPDKKRIGVALVPEGSVRAAADTIAAGARLTGKVERHERYGVFVYLAPGRTGLIPMVETGLTREADLAKTFPLGADVEVEVLEVEPDGRRIRLSRKAVLEAGEKDDLREYAQRSEPKQEGAGFGSLADKLRSALKR